MFWSVCCFSKEGNENRKQDTQLQKNTKTEFHLSLSFLPHPGSTLEVLQQHHAQQQDELSVQKGEKVMVVLPSDDGWWLVRLVGQEGAGRRSAHRWHMPFAQPCAVHSCSNSTNLPPSPFPFLLPPSLPLLPSQEYRDTATGSNTLYVPEVRQWWKLPQDLSWPAPRICTDWRRFLHLVRVGETTRGHWWVSHYIVITTPSLPHHYIIIIVIITPLHRHYHITMSCQSDGVVMKHQSPS